MKIIQTVESIKAAALLPIKFARFEKAKVHYSKILTIERLNDLREKFGEQEIQIIRDSLWNLLYENQQMKNN
jgi:hypothetical protein